MIFQIRRPNGSRDSREAEFWALKATRSNECGHLHPRVLWWQTALRSMTDVVLGELSDAAMVSCQVPMSYVTQMIWLGSLSWFAISWYILVLCGNIPVHPYSEILLVQVLPGKYKLSNYTFHSFHSSVGSISRVTYQHSQWSINLPSTSQY